MNKKMNTYERGESSPPPTLLPERRGSPLVGGGPLCLVVEISVYFKQVPSTRPHVFGFSQVLLVSLHLFGFSLALLVLCPLKFPCIVLTSGRPFLVSLHAFGFSQAFLVSLYWFNFIKTLSSFLTYFWLKLGPFSVLTSLFGFS